MTLSVQEKLAVLSSSPILSRMPATVLHAAAAEAEEIAFASGDVVFTQGDPADRFYVLIDGAIEHPEVSTTYADLSILREITMHGQLFGYAAFFESMPNRVISARVKAPSRVLAVDGRWFQKTAQAAGRDGYNGIQDLGRIFAAHEFRLASRSGWVSIRNAGKIYDPYGRRVAAVDDCSIEIRPGEFCAIVGPSGCGKSTLLNAIAGFDQLTSGEITLDREVINKPAKKPRPGPDRIVVFQNGALFPWASVLENLIRGPVVQGRMSEREAIDRGRELLAKVGLSDIEQLYPGSISSGMCRRVEIIRALLNDPRVILLDEPFRGLDALTKTVTQTALLELYDMSRKTILFITHDLEEAIYLADRVLVMTTRPGRIKQTISVNLPRPRTARLLTTPEFIRLKEEAIEAVHEEAVKAFSAGEKEYA